MRVLMIEDNYATSLSMELMLRSEGYLVETTDLGEDGIQLAKAFDYDIILLDLNLPDVHGLDVLSSLRMARVTTPVMIVSGKHDIETKVSAFGRGADDFLGKPFHKDELVARVEALVRRSRSFYESSISIGTIVVHLGSRSVEGSSGPVQLTAKEYKVIELLALRKGSIVTRDTLFVHIFKKLHREALSPDPKIVDVYICKLRKKLAEANEGLHYIESYWGRGYSIRETDESPSA